MSATHPPLPAWVPDRPRERDDLSPARGIALGVVLSLPVWWALACLASWAHGVMGGRS